MWRLCPCFIFATLGKVEILHYIYRPSQVAEQGKAKYFCASMHVYV